MLYNCWAKWANALQLLGNQFDRGTAIDFHLSHTALDQVIGHIQARN